MRAFHWIVAVAFTLFLVLSSGLVGAKKKQPTTDEEDGSRLAAETFAGLEMRGIGPALMSGRVADIVVDPDRQSTWYVAVGSGGVWKTTNAGTTWEPIFDGQTSYSIGSIALDPRNPSTVWVGTGENVGGRHVGYGDGVYRSRDGGKTWENLGLDESQHIGTILIHPEDSNVVWVASQGPLWSKGGDRGLYKTIDGGVTWKKVLGGGDYTGVNEVVMDRRDPEVLYASTHQRFRTVAALIDGGPESGVHKSTDGGESWRELTNGLPEEEMGKIGLAVSPQNPDIVYATVELAHREGGFYRSADGGESWEKRSDYLSGGTGPHYYQEIFASPHQLDRIYQMDVRLHVSDDGGESFRRVGEKVKHGDNHALAFDLEDPDYLLSGSDGGIYESFDLGATWKFVANLPVTQFYKVAVDYDEPFYHVYGGTQDNNTQGGPARTDDFSGIRNADWYITLFGDGHQPAVDPSNPDIVYAEWQQGNLTRYDRKTGESIYIQPQPEQGEPAERWNWDSPILISPHDPARLYFASQRVWRSDDRGDSWKPISGDLSRGVERLTMPMMGRIWSVDAVWDLWAMSNFGNVTSLSESPRQAGLLYAGTDDGLIHVTEDGGESWHRAGALPGVPEHAFVNDVKADLHDVDTVYVVLDNHKEGDFQPFVFASHDRGQSWKSIRGDLPDRHLVWRLVQDHEQPSLLFVGTEFGVFFTVDGGGKWVKLTGNAPTIPFRDLAIQQRENDLVGATFGRGFWVLDDYSPLRGVSEELLAQEAVLFPVKDAWWYIPKRRLGDDDEPQSSQGDAYFVAPNPPFGAVFTYYLRDDLETRQVRRRAKEKETAEEGGDTPSPGWEELEREAREEEPTIVLTVRDQAGKIVRRIEGPVAAGIHRVAWDLRRPSTGSITTGERPEDPEEDAGFLVAPGTFTVSMAKRVEGALTELAGPASFEVEPLRSGTLRGSSHAERDAFMQELGETYRIVSGVEEVVSATTDRLAAIQRALLLSPVGDDSLGEQARALEARVLDLQKALSGNEQMDDLGEPIPPAIDRRLGVAFLGNYWSTYGPTPVHRRSLEIGKAELDEVRGKLTEIVEVELAALEEKLESVGVPFTPGRKVPGAR